MRTAVGYALAALIPFASSSSDLTPRSPDPSDVDAIRALRNDAGAAGANLVLLVMETRTSIERAEGYLCADE